MPVFACKEFGNFKAYSHAQIKKPEETQKEAPELQTELQCRTFIMDAVNFEQIQQPRWKITVIIDTGA
ncbi:hypothetical protein JCM18694_07180 [Prolixibacter denitrificans]|uniref:Peptidase A2 domain-containing protein n=1 Tax=Prolixibacter denitrificans TaxID=1541063 RepID=A0ABQ0ZGI8_9BACT|nr:hypothetical protein JCM18694_07180 [Prolixibacter denitrificans]